MSCRLERAASGRLPGSRDAAVDSLALVEADSAIRHDVTVVLNDYYRSLSGGDWNGVRQTFWPNAVITGQGRDRIVVQSLQQIIQAAQSANAAVVQHPVHTHITGYGDLADAWVVFEKRTSRVGGRSDTTRGVDAFHLYRRGAQWRIAALSSTPETTEQPLSPRRLLDSAAQRPVDPVP
jgi:hypothetical protein